MTQLDKPIIKVQIQALAHGGAGIGAIVAGPERLLGKKAFVRETAAGETVEAEIIQDKKNFIEGRLLKVLNPAPQRQTPPCPVFGVCGGCDIQHLTLAAQREAKREMAESMLARQAGLRFEQGVKLIGEELPGLNYRARVILHLDDKGTLGFFKGQSNEVVEIESCPITSQPLNGLLKSIRLHIKPLRGVVEKLSIEILNAAPNAPFFIELAIAAGKRLPASKELKGLTAVLATLDRGVRLSIKNKVVFEKDLSFEAKHYPAGHFSQVNEAANAVLQQTVAGLVKSKTVSDLYGGAGNFGIRLAKHGHEVDLVEADRELTDYALRLREDNNIAEHALKLFTMRCEDFVKRHALRETVILDPPRGGAVEVMPFVKPEITSRLIYISCNLPALCRDLKLLGASGYQPRQAMVLDMFPQTHFAEIIAVLDHAA